MSSPKKANYLTLWSQNVYPTGSPVFQEMAKIEHVKDNEIQHLLSQAHPRTKTSDISFLKMREK